MPKPFRVGVMTMNVEGADEDRFERLCELGVERFTKAMEREERLAVETIAVPAPHISPSGGTYEALDFLDIAISEKAERGLAFLLVITEVDLSAQKLSYTLALPSPVANIGIVTTRRLDPNFFGEPSDMQLAADRLASLLAHTLGRLLNLPISPNPANYMYKIEGLETLDAMSEFTDSQVRRVRDTLPREAQDRSTLKGKFGFRLKTLIVRAGAILRASFRANPVALIGKLPAIMATGLSVIFVLVFGAETWDFSGAASNGQVASLAFATLVVSSLVLYRAFTLSGTSSREGRLSESVVIMQAATYLTMLLTLIGVFLVMAALVYLLTSFIVPEELKETWTTVEDARGLDDHLRLSAFLASVGILSGSLGGAASSGKLVREVLFIDDET